jgi:hypothetical protein
MEKYADNATYVMCENAHIFYGKNRHENYRKFHKNCQKF